MLHTKIPVPGGQGGQSRLARFVDHSETYGPRVIADMIAQLRAAKVIVDLGAGGGRDLAIARRAHPTATTVAIDASELNAAALAAQGHVVHRLDLERDHLPFAGESVDAIIANQVLEHTKEIFWIFHEVARTLRIGGHFIFGVPNVCSLHNRLLMLAGRHPTQHKLYSAHVRPFSKDDTLRFLEVCAPGVFEVRAFAGSQFYPAPAAASRLLARAFPGAAFSIFFMVRKAAAYDGGFLKHPVDAALETNFWLGPTG